MNRQNKKNQGLYFKDKSAIKFVHYIKIVSIAVAIAICLYTGILSMALQQPFVVLISENMTVVCGFIMAVESLLTYYVARQYLKDFETGHVIEGNRLKLLMLTVFSGCFANIVSLIFGILALIKIYEWESSFSFSGMLRTLKEEKQVGICAALFIIYAMLFVLQIIIGSLVLR